MKRANCLASLANSYSLKYRCLLAEKSKLPDIGEIFAIHRINNQPPVSAHSHAFHLKHGDLER
jgi:hypothetical protein